MTHYFKAMSGAVNLEGGKVKLLSRGDTLDGISLADGEHDRLLAQGALATEAEWSAGESTPHHLRRPHRSTLDPRDQRDPEQNLQKVVVDLAPPSASAEVEIVGTEAEIMERTRSVEAAMAAGVVGEGEDERGSNVPDLNGLSDDALIGLYEGPRPPLVSDMVDAVGDDPVLAQRVLDVEMAGPNRSTLTTKLERVIDDGADDE